MKKLQISKEHKELIESVIIENDKFKGNEELINIFLEAIYKKSYLLIDAIRDLPRLKRHLASICDTCMEQIISEKKKFDDTKLYKEISQKTDEVKAQEIIVSLKKKSPLRDEDEENASIRGYQKKNSENEIINLKEEIKKNEQFSPTDALIDPLNFVSQKKPSEQTLNRILTIVKNINEKNPNKRFYEIFYLRYIKKYNQTEIARQMRISQMELSKRFVEMVRLVNEY